MSATGEGTAPTVAPALAAWRAAQVVEVRDLAPSVRGILLAVAGWPGHRAGQYVDVRPLNEPAAARSFSVADVEVDGEIARVELVVQLPPDGAALHRPWAVGALRVGERVELAGPKGEKLTWAPGETGGRPLFLIAGGTGIAPLMSVLRAWVRSGEQGAARVLHSVRTVDARIFADELAQLARTRPVEVATIVTRERGAGDSRAGGRLGALDLEVFGWPASDAPECFVCGPAGFVDAVTRMLVQMGHDAARIHTERVVPRGG